MPVDHRPLVERFDAMTRHLDNGCIEWVGTRNANGYGRFKPGKDRTMMLAHRWAYEYHVGPIPDGLVIDHLCRNPSCVNAEHLEAVTQLVNIQRGRGNGSKTHCPSGHAYDSENTYSYRGARQCRACAKSRRKAA